MLSIHEALRDRADLAPRLDRGLGPEPAGGDLHRERRETDAAALDAHVFNMRPAHWFVKIEGHAPSTACS
jgi:hypothetical protein